MPTKTMSRQKHVLDAKGQILGRLATQVADLLRGKNKVEFELHQDCGDYVTVINAEKITVTGNKLEDKIYYSHSGHPGNLKETQLKDLMAESPAKVIEHAVNGMLPKNRLRSGWMRRLKVYAGEER